MNTDVYYEIGSSHRVCEDYTLSGIFEDMAYTIVSDGCSSSKHSDLGARLLTHVAKGVLYYLKNRNYINSQEVTSIFQELVIKKCLEVKHTLGLPINVFDATLLISVVFDNNIWCVGWGDGYFIFVDKDDHKIVIETIYESGAPYYLSHEMSLEKKEAYEKEYGNSELIVNTYDINTTGDYSTIRHSYPPTYLYPVNLNHPIQNYKFIVAASDGINTYEDNPKLDPPDGSSEHKRYSALEMIPSIVGYKGTAGEFVVRRMNRLKFDMDKVNRIHSDDVSCTAINLNS